jgi:hypothetical protein
MLGGSYEPGGPSSNINSCEAIFTLMTTPALQPTTSQGRQGPATPSKGNILPGSKDQWMESLARRVLQLHRRGPYYQHRAHVHRQVPGKWLTREGVL